LVGNTRQPDRVELVGYVPRAELVRLYQAADALVVTSRFEGFGLPSLEAMAMGTPVVAFDNSAVAEVVGDGGVLVPDGDTQALVDELAGILSDPALRERLSQAGRRRAGAFTWKESARRHAEVYAQAAEANRGTP
jgi:glycosyltransferase involved in cell wall biosynthesis